MVQPSSGTTRIEPHSLSWVVQAYEVSTQKQSYNKIVGCVILLCRLILFYLYSRCGEKS
jgi:hypothetical protein